MSPLRAKPPSPKVANIPKGYLARSSVFPSLAAGTLKSSKILFKAVFLKAIQKALRVTWPLPAMAKSTTWLKLPFSLKPANLPPEPAAIRPRSQRVFSMISLASAVWPSLEASSANSALILAASTFSSNLSLRILSIRQENSFNAWRSLGKGTAVPAPKKTMSASAGNLDIEVPPTVRAPGQMILSLPPSRV